MVITKKVFILILTFSIISNTITLYKTFCYDKIQNNLDGKEIQVNATVVSNPTNKEYKKVYKIKVESAIINQEKIKQLKNQNVYLNINNKDKVNLQYGDKIKITGIFNKPQSRTNYKAFDYNEYLRTKGICGIVEGKSIKKCGETKEIRNFYS